MRQEPGQPKKAPDKWAVFVENMIKDITFLKRTLRYVRMIRIFN